MLIGSLRLAEAPIDMLGKLGQLVQQQQSKQRHRENRSDHVGVIQVSSLMQVTVDFHDQANPEQCIVSETELAVDHYVHPSYAMEQLNDHPSPPFVRADHREPVTPNPITGQQ